MCWSREGTPVQVDCDDSGGCGFGLLDVAKKMIHAPATTAHGTAVVQNPSVISVHTARATVREVLS